MHILWNVYKTVYMYIHTYMYTHIDHDQLCLKYAQKVIISEEWDYEWFLNTFQ